MHIHENYSLEKLNTFGVDVLSRYFASFSSAEELKELLYDKKFENKSRLILGGGSNILFTKNFEGIILKNELKGIELTGETENHYIVKAAAGEVWHSFVLHCIKNNYAGLENLSLIPGCVGAAPMQNIGAYGVEMKDYFEKLEALNIESGTIETFHAQQCEFGYRESIFKRKAKDKYVILSVTFRLNKTPVFNTSYGAIEQQLEKSGIKTLSLKAVSDAVVAIRQSKLPDPEKTGNAGSFFKNPETEPALHHELKKQYPEMVSYPLSNGNFKIAAGWLIEKAGWKGKNYGTHGVHKNQALVLVNFGGAKGSEIYNLSEQILTDVKTRFGIVLEREVNIC